MSATATEERQSLLVGGGGANTGGSYGAVSQSSPRLCLVFSDGYLGGQKSEWLAKLKVHGFEVEQTSPNYVAIAAPDQMLQTVAAQKGSHGLHTMPATRERVLHLLLSEYDPTLGAFLEAPGPYSRRSKQSAAAIAPRYAWSGFFGLSRKDLGLARDYFGSEIAWYLLQMNFVARWMAVPACAGGAYTYFMGLTFLQTGSFDNQFFPVFSGALAIYGCVMLGFWLRLKGRYEDKWQEDVKISGTEDLNTDAEMEHRVDEETGELVLFYPQWKHNLRRAVASVLLLLPLAGVLAAGLGALDVRARLMNMYPPVYGGLLAGAVTAVLLYVVVRLICFQWAGVFSHWENHSTRSGFHSAVAAKCFSLETLAHLLPVLYIALINQPLLSRFAPANEPSIVDALTIQATSVFVMWWLCVATVSSVQAWRWHTRAQGVAEELGAEGGKPDFNHREQAARPRFPGAMESRAWLSLQLLYSFALGACCPLAPVLLYFWVMHRLHHDKTALIYVFQRPHPQSAPSGGFWTESFQIIIVVALAVQIPLILFCTRAVEWWLPSVTLEERWGLLGSLEMLVAALSAYLLARSLRLGGDASEKQDRVVMV